MNDFLDTLNYYLQQAWVYLPMVLSFITAFGLPSLVQIAKIFASAKLYLTQVKTLLKKVNECVDTIDKMVDFIDAFVDKELEHNEQMIETTINRKQKQMLENHKIELLDMKKQSATFKVQKVGKADLPTKAEKKVKVRVKKVD